MSVYRSEHVGSLLRPPRLLEARKQHAAGKLSDEALAAAEDEAIVEALALQRQSGIEVATDGEYRRFSFHSVFWDNVDGFVSAEAGRLRWHGDDGKSVDIPLAAVVGGKLRARRRLVAAEAAFMREHARTDFKVTVPSASNWGYVYADGVSQSAYPTYFDMLTDVTEIIAAEARALAEEGVPYVQLDAPIYASDADPEVRDGWRARGIDPVRKTDADVEADNACIEAAQAAGAIVGVHACRGNAASLWLAQGGYEPVAERVLGGLKADRLLLEYDSERAGGFEPLRFVPRGERPIVVLGLISSKTAGLEDPEEIIRRVEQAARYVPIEQLALSPQCGFASAAEYGNRLSWDDQRRKLELVAETASRIWPDDRGQAPADAGAGQGISQPAGR